MLFKAYLGRNPKLFASPPFALARCAALCGGGGAALHGRCECSPGVHSSKIMVLSLFPDNSLLFLLSWLLWSLCSCYTHLAILTWWFCFWMTVASSDPIVSYMKLRLVNFCHHVSLYSHLHKCHLLFCYQPLSLIAPCELHQSQPLLLMPWLT